MTWKNHRGTKDRAQMRGKNSLRIVSTSFGCLEKAGDLIREMLFPKLQHSSFLCPLVPPCAFITYSGPIPKNQEQNFFLIYLFSIEQLYFKKQR